ncbi:MAG: dUTP diphosphatase [Planctomycetota bacterium]
METRAIDVPVTVLEHGLGLALPAYETEGSAGLDVRAAVREPLLVAPGERVRVPTGLAIAVPPGWECQVRPRSGWAAKHGVTCLNTPGTIDSDYRGEVQVLLVNLGQEPVRIERGDRIAQLVFAPVGRATWRVQGTLEATTRGAGGFGHTGA